MKKAYHLIVLFFLPIFLFAQKTLPYQGKLLETGNPVTGTVSMQFSISSLSWTETHESVTVQDGYYSLVLGTITPLPDNLFFASDQVDLAVSVNGQSLTTSTLHAPFIDPTVHNADITTFDGNGNRNAVIGKRSEAAPNEGAVNLFDPYDNQLAFIQAREGGGRVGILQADPNNQFYSAGAFLGHQSFGNAFFDIYGLNNAGDNFTPLIDMFITDKDRFGATHTGGYRRSGVDFFDNSRRELATIGIEKDENTQQRSGQVILWGPNTPNVQIAGEIWGNGDQAIISLMGQDANGSWGWSNAELRTYNRGSDSGGALNLYNSTESGNTPTVSISSSNGTNEGGHMLISNSSGNSTILLDGGDGSVSAEILRSANGTVQTSDERLKKNIQPLEKSLDNVTKIRGVYYHWKDERNTERQLGVIAQEIEKVYPELVYTDSKGMKAVNYAQMTAVLIEAVKELSAKVDQLEEANKSLRSENSALNKANESIDALEAKLDQIEQTIKIGGVISQNQ